MRLLGYLNLLGVVVLAGLCTVQWNANRRLNLLAMRLDKTRQEQAEIAEQETSIKGYMADLDDFRDRLERSEEALKKSEMQIASLTADRDRTISELARTTAERDETRKALTEWMAALKERDDALKRVEDGIQSLAKDRDTAVAKFNDLAVKYNALVKDLDDARAKLAAKH